MRHILLSVAALSAAVLPAAAAVAAPRAQSAQQTERVQSGVRAGVLECNVGGSVGFIVGSRRDVECTFRSRRGAPQRYVGTINRFGLDIGVTQRSVMVWQVVAPSNDVNGSLSGRYSGVSAGASAVVGATANVLVGGGSGSVNLQPLSVEAQRGVNLAAGVASLNLRPADRRG